MISVIIPVLNEAATIQAVVAHVQRDPQVSQVLVVDDGSVDGTPELAQAMGAQIISSSLLGKGASMEDGARAATNECLVFLDGDLLGLAPDLVQRLARPILDGTADLVKGRFSRRAGRVTELVAKPLLRVFLPELAGFTQPLGGLIGARRSRLLELDFENDYGVDLGLLIDAVMSGFRVVEVDLGHIEHDSQPLEVLGDMAGQVARTLLLRAARYGRLGTDAFEEVEQVERFMRAELEALTAKVRGGERLALVDMDGTLLDGRFAVSLAQATGKQAELAGLLDSATLPALVRAERIAALWAGVDKAIFERVAREIPLMPGAAEAVVALRRSGYRVAIVTDSYQIAAEVVRRRVFADAAVAYLLRFEGRRCTGQLLTPAAMRDARGEVDAERVKRHVAERLMARLDMTRERTAAIGDGLNDIPMFEAVGRAVAVGPKDPRVAAAAGAVAGSLHEAVRLILAPAAPSEGSGGSRPG